jgi:hypothetical protein
VHAPDPIYKPLKAQRKSSDPNSNDPNASEGPLIGENTNLEKPYLRLTTFPRKEDVRPLEVLTKSLAHIKSRYVRDEDFEWANEQLKSVRQDLTVQNIRNRFVLDVYETHARILLENGDLDEFNQCQTMIRSLTEGTDSSEGGKSANGHKMPGSKKPQKVKHQPLHQSEEHAQEFLGYALLYALVRNSGVDLKRELARMKAIPAECDRETSCSHALQVVRSVEECDYKTFFRLYQSAPHMSAYLMDFLVKRVRDGAYQRIIAAYRPTVGVEEFRECLHLDDLEETRRFLRQNGAVFIKEQDGNAPFWVDCKASSHHQTDRAGSVESVAT